MDRDVREMRQLFGAKLAVTEALTARGVALDAQAREAIGWTLISLIEGDGVDAKAAVEIVIRAHLPHRTEVA
ncbi:MAG: hypothetical protein U1E67_08325 [Hyphomicrobiales bacterium]